MSENSTIAGRVAVVLLEVELGSHLGSKCDVGKDKGGPWLLFLNRYVTAGLPAARGRADSWAPCPFIGASFTGAQCWKKAPR